METVCIESRLFSPPFHLRFRLDGTNYRHVSREPAQSQFQLAPGVYLYRRTAVEKRPPPPLAHPLFRGKLKEPRSRGLEIIDFNQPSSLAWPQKRNCAGEFGSIVRGIGGKEFMGCCSQKSFHFNCDAYFEFERNQAARAASSTSQSVARHRVIPLLLRCMRTPCFLYGTYDFFTAFVS